VLSVASSTVTTVTTARTIPLVFSIKEFFIINTFLESRMNSWIVLALLISPLALADDSTTSSGSGSGGSGGGDSCVDHHLKCQFWSKTGECDKNKDWMSKNCAGSCAKSNCNQVVVKVKKCEDHESQCSTWKSSGECDKNPDYMLWKCTKSCGYCSGGSDSQGSSTTTSASTGSSTSSTGSSGGGSSTSSSGGGDSCVDRHLKCQFWSKTGECDKNKDWMSKNCAGSCSKSCDQIVVKVKKCHDEDGDAKCKQWKDDGQCDKNTNYMLWKCTKTCGFCAGSGNGGGGSSS